MRLRADKRAFTLIELLVVVAIISLLVCILVPALRSAKDLARDSVCRSHLRGTIFTGLSLYAQDNEGWIPPTGFSRDLAYASWLDVLQATARWCQGYDADGPILGDLLTKRTYVPSTDSTLFCPSVQAPYTNGYGLSGYMATGDDTGAGVAVRSQDTDQASYYYQYNLFKTRKPSAMYLAGDSNWTIFYLIIGSSPNTSLYPSFRHFQRSNVLYHDGHVSGLPMSQMPRPSGETPRRLPWFNGTSEATNPNMAYLPPGFPWP